MASNLSEIEKAADLLKRLGPARAEAVRLLAEAADGIGVWMHNLTNGAKALVRHEDTLARLITEGWTHEAPVSAPTATADDAPNEPIPSTVTATPPQAADVASLPETSDTPTLVSEAAPAPSESVTEPSDETPAKGKKA